MHEDSRLEEESCQEVSTATSAALHQKQKQKKWKKKKKKKILGEYRYKARNKKETHRHVASHVHEPPHSWHHEHGGFRHPSDLQLQRKNGGHVQHRLVVRDEDHWPWWRWGGIHINEGLNLVLLHGFAFATAATRPAARGPAPSAAPGAAPGGAPGAARNAAATARARSSGAAIIAAVRVCTNKRRSRRKACFVGYMCRAMFAAAFYCIPCVHGADMHGK